MGGILDRAVLSGEHEVVVALMAELAACIAEPAPETERVARIRWRMTRVLLTHLAKEDALLYPSLRSAAEPRVAAMARRFSEEMGDLAAVYRDYIAGWPTERIEREWQDFCADTRGILKALTRRIEREEQTLYPMIPFSELCRNAA